MAPPVEPWLLVEAAGASSAQVDECVTAGMLKGQAGGVSFRHELARLTVERALGPGRRADLHGRVLAALLAHGGAAPDPARVAHHADGAGDATAVLAHAPVAARRAAALGAHREAAASMHGRCGSPTGWPHPAARAELLEGHSYECYLTDQLADAVASRERALSCWRALKDRGREGDTLRWRSRLAWWEGRQADAERAGRAVRPDRDPGPCPQQRRHRRVVREVAGRAAHAGAEPGAGPGPRPGGARRPGLHQLGLDRPRPAPVPACGLLPRGRDPVLHRTRPGHLAAVPAGVTGRADFEQGRWTEATRTVEIVLRDPRTAPVSRIKALAVLGRLRARRGDPGVWPAFDEALALGTGTGELQRLGPVAVARAEAAWLEGGPAAARGGGGVQLDLAERTGGPGLALADRRACLLAVAAGRTRPAPNPGAAGRCGRTVPVADGRRLGHGGGALAGARLPL
jgi:hypothetical protein